MRSLRRKRKLAGRKNFWQRFVYTYRLNLENHDELTRIWSRKFSYLRFVSMLLVFALAVASGTLFIYENTPSIKNNTHRDRIARQQMVSDALRIDSIENVVRMQERYVAAIRDIFQGRVVPDTISSVDSLVRNMDYQLEMAGELEQQFVEDYEERERYNITNSYAQTVAQLSTRTLFKPISGVVVKPFNLQDKHYGVDVGAFSNQSIIAIMDGIVLFSAYTANNGNVIGISHPDNVISIYKNCASISVQEGDKVKAGQVLGLVRQTETSNNENSYMHFELWYSGQPLDPERYLVF